MYRRSRSRVEREVLRIFKIAALWIAAAAFLLAPGAAFTAASAAGARAPQHTSSSTTAKKKKKRRRRRSRRQSYQKAPTPQRISEIQSALARGGYYQGDPSGKWDSHTMDALQKFQSANGLEPSGKLDAPSLQKMGLGSDIAGVSAPKPLPPAGSAPPATLRTPAPTAPALKVNPPSTPVSSAPSIAPPSPASSAAPSPKS